MFRDCEPSMFDTFKTNGESDGSNEVDKFNA